MPNGADAPGGTGIIGPIINIATSFIRGFFGGGAGPQINVQTVEEANARRAASGLPPLADRPFPGFPAGTIFPIGDPRRAPIPTPAEGGPPLVTERFAELPGPFVDTELGILPFELRTPPEDIFSPPVPFQPGPVPVPDVPELEELMAIDAPLLSGFGGALLPAVRQAAPVTVGALTGGFLQDIVGGLFARAPQAMGLGQVPMPVSPGRVACPPERPSTRILRMIQMSTGVRVKLSSAKALIRQLGLQNGARCLGISITDACTLIITSSPRRRRGISGSDIRIVKRTARRFQSLQEDLSGLVSRRRAAPRRRTRHVHAIAHTAPGA